MSKIPDFFIVGGPKCGTTALFEYINQHQDIFMPERKEINYFGKDLQFKNYHMDFEFYCSLFKSAQKGQKVGEASVWSLFSKTAAEEIYDINPKAKIIIMVRNPVPMLHSLFCELKYTGDEDSSTFEEALSLESDRANGVNIPPNAFALHSTQYRKIGLYFEQVERYVKQFGSERVRIILQEDMYENSLKEVSDVFDFLGVNSDFIPEIEKHNGNKVVRNRLLRNFIHRPPEWVRIVVRFIVRNRSVREVITNVAVNINRKINSKPAERELLKQETKVELREYFLTDIERLEILLGRDLSVWKGE